MAARTAPSSSALDQKLLKQVEDGIKSLKNKSIVESYFDVNETMVAMQKEDVTILQGPWCVEKDTTIDLSMNVSTASTDMMSVLVLFVNNEPVAEAL